MYRCFYSVVRKNDWYRLHKHYVFRQKATNLKLYRMQLAQLQVAQALLSPAKIGSPKSPHGRETRNIVSVHLPGHPHLAIRDDNTSIVID